MVRVIDQSQRVSSRVRGWQVASAELEGVLVTHPKTVDAAVLGVKRGETEAPRAYRAESSWR